MMKFNVDKCKTLRLTRRTKNSVDYKYLMSTPNCKEPISFVPQNTLDSAGGILTTVPPNGNFQSLEVITSDRYLGIILDSRLSFNQHVKAICSKASRILDLCRRNLVMCSSATKVIAYKALIRPQLEYASAAWNPHTKRNMDRLEGVQRRAARWVLGNYTYGPNAHLTDQIAKQLQWQSLQHRRAISDLSLFYKIRNELVNVNFPPAVQRHYRGGDKYQNIQANHSEAYKYGFYCRTVRLWNQLPAVVTGSSTIQVFRSSAATWMTPLVWHRTPVTGVWTLA